MASTFRVTMKNGDSRYDYNSKSEKYEFQNIDYVDTYDNLPSALLGFLEWATDSGLEDKLILTVIPEKKKKKSKKEKA